VAGPRPSEQYVRVLREGLELTARMRMLVEALRELVDMEQMKRTEQTGPGEAQACSLDRLLRETGEELRPVADARKVRVVTTYDAALTLPVEGKWLASLVFRFLESALSLAREASEFRITVTRGPTRILLAVSWIDGPLPEHSPFSGPELGLLIAQAGWERAGAEWDRKRTGNGQTCTVALPLPSLLPSPLPSPLHAKQG
jgi:hypothetical protein